MSDRIYKLSSYVRTVLDSESGAAMVYHSLYGNPRIVNREGLDFLSLFKNPITISRALDDCDGDPSDVINEFSEIFFLIEPGFDEKKFLQQQREIRLLIVESQKSVDRMGLAISDSCNFGCKHCIHFQQSSCSEKEILPTYQKSVTKLNMSFETAKNCVDHYIALMRAQGIKRCKIHFGNAEPLINWPVIEKVLCYCESMTDLTFDFAINTNLVLMTREIASVFKKHKVRIATSLDGLAKANDAIRVTKGGQGTFDLILEKFDLLNEVGYPLDGFSITVTNGNFELVDTDIIDLATERGMTSIAFDYDLIALVGISTGERVEKLMRLKRYANERGIDFFGTWDSAFRNLTGGNLLLESRSFCAAVEGKSLEFNVDGSIKVCSHATSQIGHVDQFDQIFQKEGKLLKLVNERFPGADQCCYGCILEGLCGGQCHVTREVVSRLSKESGHNLFADMCDFYRQVTRALAVDYIRSNGVTVASGRSVCGL